MDGLLMKKKRKTKNIYDKYLNIDNLYAAWKIVKKTCKNKKEIYFFSLNLNSNLMKIYKELKNRTYKPNKFRCFMIFEPKARLVMSQSVRDKIVNHFITNYYLLPYLESSLINENVATRKNKGTGYAGYLVKKHLKNLINNKPKEIYALKIDISKYFYNIDHKLLIDKLNKDMYDKNVINLIKLFLNETNKDYVNKNIIKYNNYYKTDIPLYKNNKGLSIGAVTSQFLAIYYCNDLHHFIKEKLRCKHVIIYMDDYLILDTNKDRLKEIWFEIDKYLINLKLKINKKSNIYSLSNGFNFLGYNYRYINSRLLIGYDKKTFYKINKKLKYLKENDILKYKRSYASYYGYLKNIDYRIKESFKMSLEEINNSYKLKYKNTLIIIKEGIFYKTLFDDGKIIWYLFRYKYIKNTCSFGIVPYDKVIDKLKELDIPFVVVSKTEEIIQYHGDNKNYNCYLELATKAYDKYELEQLLIEKLKKVCRNNSKNVEKIDKFLSSLINESI